MSTNELDGRHIRSGLRAEGLVRTRRESQTIFHALASAEAAAVIEVLAGLYCDRPPTGHSSSNQPFRRETST